MYFLVGFAQNYKYKVGKVNKSLLCKDQILILMKLTLFLSPTCFINQPYPQLANKSNCMLYFKRKLTLVLIKY